MFNPKVFQLVGGVLVLGVMSHCQRLALRSDEPISLSHAVSQRDFRLKKLETLGGLKKSLWILPFVNHSEFKWEGLEEWLASELQRGLEITQRVLIPPDSRSWAMSLDPQQRSSSDSVQMIHEAKKRGVAVVILGHLRNIVFRYQKDDVGLLRKKQSQVAVVLEIQAIEVFSGRSFLSRSQIGESADEIMSLFNKTDTVSQEYREPLVHHAAQEAIAIFIPEILKSVDQLMWQGRVAQVSGERIFVTGGQSAGLQLGDILKVLSPGEEVYDHATGSYLGHSQGYLKATLEVIEYLGMDAALTVIHSGGSVKEGDWVQLY